MTSTEEHTRIEYNWWGVELIMEVQKAYKRSKYRLLVGNSSSRQTKLEPARNENVGEDFAHNPL
jgi:hypothetical protein